MSSPCRVRRQACVAVAALAVVTAPGCGSAADTAGTGSTRATSDSTPATIVHAPGTTVATIDEGPGTLTMTFVAPSDGRVTGDRLARVAARADTDLSTHGFDVDVATHDGKLQVVVRDVTVGDRSSILDSLHVTAGVYLRPVNFCYRPSPSVPEPNLSDTTATSASGDSPQQQLLSTSDGELCEVGESAGDGSIFVPDSAQAEIIGGGWGVTVALQPGAAGEDVFNVLAAECYSGESACPSHRLAFEVDGVIVSAPTVNAPTFSGTVEISGQFSKDDADAVADAVNIGAPINFQLEATEFTALGNS